MTLQANRLLQTIRSHTERAFAAVCRGFRRTGPGGRVFAAAAGSLLVFAGAFVPSGRGAELGALKPLYRSTQLQGHLFGMGLTELPSFLTAPGLAFRYRRRADAKQEIPFVDSFTINRVMGGYREDWLQKFHLVNADLGRRTLDYVTRGTDGTLQFHPDLIRARLQPYLGAGYKPSDITLALDNPPWDLATPDGAPPHEGPWGRKTPPGNLDEWSTVVRQFAADLKMFLGQGAEQVGFETGVEYDEKESFEGSADQFLHYYEATERALHSVLPKARFGPGEFTGAGTCAPASGSCVYDTATFLESAGRAGLEPATVPRSLHAFLDRGNPSPLAAAERFHNSYSRLPRVVAEIHQFGLLFEPFESIGEDPGPMQASWEFQALIHILENDRPQRVFHWGGLVEAGRVKFVNGSGFLRLVLDHYLGARMRTLPIHDAAPPFPAETLALEFYGEDRPALIVSSFSARPKAGVRSVTVDSPPEWPRGTQAKTVRLRMDQNVFASIKRDLAADNNLRAAFDACGPCLGVPARMASDPARANQMLNRNWPRYETEMMAGLTWNDHDNAVIVGANSVRADLEANEMLVLQPLAPP